MHKKLIFEEPLHRCTFQFFKSYVIELKQQMSRITCCEFSCPNTRFRDAPFRTKSMSTCVSEILFPSIHPKQQLYNLLLRIYRDRKWISMGR